MFLFKKTKNFFVVLSKIKAIYIVFIFIFLLQFVFVSITLYQNSKDRILLDRMYNRVMTSESKQAEISEKINSMQSELTRISVQLYRVQAISNSKK